MWGRVGGGLAAIVLDGEQHCSDVPSRSHHPWEDLSSFRHTQFDASRPCSVQTASEMEGTDPKGRCNYCNVYAGRDKVKTCGRCRLVAQFARSTSDLCLLAALQAWCDTAPKNARWLRGGPTNRGALLPSEKALPKIQRPMHSTQRSRNGSIIGGSSSITGRFGPWI